MSSLYGKHLELPWDAEIAPATFEVAIISCSIGGSVCLDTRAARKGTVKGGGRRTPTFTRGWGVGSTTERPSYVDSAFLSALGAHDLPQLRYAQASPRVQSWVGGPGKHKGRYEKPPPGLIKEDETKPEDCIPDVPGNEHAREFLAHAPTKGLWMPLGKEVKVMQCWRCKRYGHRTGDKECPFFIKGNQKLEQFRVVSRTPPCPFTCIRDSEYQESGSQRELQVHIKCIPSISGAIYISVELRLCDGVVY
ncbi:uncharacterized protein LOC120602430 isoform X2 [Pteropus medius]|uniref:uncharacterized protein LOC120602430 isoform X2 n=1 Tax=Pteropus vampyrus TaxID=132908 RepID=UPI00196A2575|nr:uncharacterized protein LOC120602430 isoform X2 [Pteropus giganteus]